MAVSRSRSRRTGGEVLGAGAGEQRHPAISGACRYRSINDLAITPQDSPSASAVGSASVTSLCSGSGAESSVGSPPVAASASASDSDSTASSASSPSSAWSVEEYAVSPRLIARRVVRCSSPNADSVQYFPVSCAPHAYAHFCQ